MKLFNIKSKNFIQNSHRLDAKTYLSEGNLVIRYLENSPYPLKNIEYFSKDIFYGGRDKRYYVNNVSKGIPFMGSADMLKSDFSGLKLISKKLTKNINNYLLDKNWILISRSGTVGNVSFTSDLFKGKAASEHIIRIVPKDDIYEGFLYAYLASKYGHNLLTQGKFGAVIQHIEPEFISTIPVPIFPVEKQQRIHQLIVEASELRVEASRSQDEAVSYFNTKYPINGLTKIFTKSAKDLDFNLAAYNNNLEVDKIYSENKDDFLTLNQVVDKCFAPPMFKHIYLNKDNGHPFLTGAELTKFNKKFYRWLSLKGVKNINDYKVEKGTLLLYKSGNTDGGILGNIFIADDILDGACLSDHVIRIFTNDLNMSYWIYAFFKSDAGIRILQKTATGSMIPFITPERLLNLRIPKPDDQYETVSELIEKSLKCSVDSQIAENQAIALIEKEIDLWQVS